MIDKKTIIYILFLLAGFSFTFPANAQCGNCQPSGLSLLYNFLPGQVRQFTNPVVRANQVVNTVRNPYLLASPCNPITNTAINLIRTNARGNLTGNQNSHISNYIPQNYNPQINQNAYVSGFDAGNDINPETGYFDAKTNSFVWILPSANESTSEDLIP